MKKLHRLCLVSVATLLCTAFSAYALQDTAAQRQAAEQQQARQETAQKQQARSAQKSRERQPEAYTHTEIVNLQHAPVRELVRIVSATPGVKVLSDERTNALILHGTELTVAAANELVLKLDVPVQAKRDTVKAYQLQHAAADGRLQNMLHSLAGRSRTEPLMLAVDESTNQVVAQGSERSIAMVDQLVQMIDKPAVGGASHGGQVQVRVVWLVGGQGRDVPNDLQPVTTELGLYGVSNLRLAAQTIIRVTEGEKFENRFSTTLEDSWDVRMEGTLSPSGGQSVQIGLIIDAQRRRTERQQSNLNTSFETTITTPTDHFVVLNTSPLGDTESVFVVQVMGAK